MSYSFRSTGTSLCYHTSRRARNGLVDSASYQSVRYFIPFSASDSYRCSTYSLR